MNTKTIFSVLSLAAIVYLFGCATEEVCDKDTVLSEYLISVEDVASLISQNSDSVTILDVSPEADFKKEHLPNALNVWRSDFRTKGTIDYDGMICSADELERLLSRLGITRSTRLFLYDRKGGCDAMRLAWVLDQYGISHYQVINGGLTLWKQMGYTIDTSAAIVPDSTRYIVSDSIFSSYATIDDVKSAMGDPNTLLIDTRESYEYKGLPFLSDGKVHDHKKGAYDRGHIPTAIHLNWSELSDLSNDHRIKCRKDLRHNLLSKDITPDHDIIVYCQSGTRSAHTAFVLSELLGYPSVKNYDGSWIEWSYEYKKGNVEIEQIADQYHFSMIKDSLLQISIR